METMGNCNQISIIHICHSSHYSEPCLNIKTVFSRYGDSIIWTNDSLVYIYASLVLNELNHQI